MTSETSALFVFVLMVVSVFAVFSLITCVSALLVFVFFLFLLLQNEVCFAVVGALRRIKNQESSINSRITRTNNHGTININQKLTYHRRANPA
jgi:hypothetical protein